MTWTRAIQYLDTAKDEAEAHMMAAALRTQEGCLGVRTLPASPVTPVIRVQAFFTDDGPAGDGWLPAGCRRVMLPDRLLASLTDTARERPCVYCAGARMARWRTEYADYACDECHARNLRAIYGSGEVAP